MPSTRAELVAMDVYQRAETTGQVITLDMCMQRVTELRPSVDLPVRSLR